MVIVTTVSGDAGGVGKSTITLALMLHCSGLGIIDLSLENRSISLLLGLNPIRDLLDSINGGRFTMSLNNGNVVVPLRHREIQELREAWSINPRSVSNAIIHLAKLLRAKYGIRNLVIDSMSVTSMGLVKGAVDASDELLVVLTRDKAESIIRKVKSFNKNMALVMNKVTRDPGHEADVTVPYVDAASNQLEVAMRIGKYARKIGNVILE